MIVDDVMRISSEAKRRFREGFVKEDASIFMSSYADDAIIFPPDSAIARGRGPIEAYWEGVIAAGVKEARLETVELLGDGEYVQEWGTGILTIQSPGEASVERAIKFVVIWTRTAEGWKILWDIWNRTP